MDLNFTLTNHQMQFLQSDKKFKLFFSGIGSGKSYVAMLNILTHALKNPKSVSAVIMANHSSIKNVAYVLVDELLPAELISNINLSDRDLKLTNGSRIIFRSGNDEGQIQKLRGLSISAFWIDEITLMPPSIWLVLVGRLRQRNMPYIGLATSNPKMGWVHQQFIAEELSDEYFLLDRIPTYSNTFLPDEYITSLENEYSGLYYDQEILGHWVTFENVCYNFNIEEPPENIRHSNIFIGIDYGYHDPTAIVILREINKVYYVIDEVYKTQLTNSDVVKELQALETTYGKAVKIYCDPSAAGTIEEIRRSGFNIVASKNKRADGIRITANMVQNNLFVSEKCTNLIDESLSYTFKNSDSETQGTDHACDSLRYVCYGLHQKYDSDRFIITGK